MISPATHFHLQVVILNHDGLYEFNPIESLYNPGFYSNKKEYP